MGLLGQMLIPMIGSKKIPTIPHILADIAHKICMWLSNTCDKDM